MFDYGGTTGLSSLIAKNHPHPTARDESGAMQSGPYRRGKALVSAMKAASPLRTNQSTTNE